MQKLYHTCKPVEAVHLSDHISVQTNPNNAVEKDIELICDLDGDTPSY